MTGSELRRSMLLIAAIALAGCASGHRAARTADAVFVLVRHAEKAADDPKDPSLSEAGQTRATNLAAVLKRVDAVYATRYRRTQLTAAPVAAANGLTTRTYDAAMSAEAFVQQLRVAHPRDTVLVVGHSNTVAQIAAALCGCIVEPLREDEYDRMITVRIDRDGKALLEQARY
jgi:broad specificity phosphatase PhoE